MPGPRGQWQAETLGGEGSPPPSPSSTRPQWRPPRCSGSASAQSTPTDNEARAARLCAPGARQVPRSEARRAGWQQRRAAETRGGTAAFIVRPGSQSPGRARRTRSCPAPTCHSRPTGTSRLPASPRLRSDRAPAGTHHAARAGGAREPRDARAGQWGFGRRHACARCVRLRRHWVCWN